MVNNNLIDDGVEIHQSFLSASQLIKLNGELDLIFKKIVFNRELKSAIYVNKYLNEVSLPVYTIDSVNLLELCIDVFKKFKRPDGDYILTNLAIFSESNNPHSLFWHTDGRRGMYRAQIYLKGGTSRSGGFKYLRGTHNLEHGVVHKLANIDAYRDEIIDCSGAAGDLILFDPYGFHAKNICLDERRTIMFEFQRRADDFIKSSILLDSKKLTSMVVKDISLFTAAPSSHYYGHGLDQADYFSKNLAQISTKIIPAIAKLSNLMHLIRNKFGS